MKKRRDTEIAIGVRIVDCALRRHFDTMIMSKYEGNITGTNVWLILHIAMETSMGHDVFQYDLEKASGVTRSAISRVVKLMEQKGLIRRESVAHDARLKKLVLTERAKKIAEEMWLDSQRTEEELIDGFSEEEIRQLDDYLKRMAQNMGAGKSPLEDGDIPEELRK